MPRENIWFLCSKMSEAQSQLSPGREWGLTVVKVGGKVGVAYLAFASKQLANSFNHGFEGWSAIDAANLDDRYFHHFGDRPVVLFKTEQDVKSYRAHRGNFPYEDHLFRYSLADGLSEP